ncbi:hypothetical protein GXN76_04110 [Kroppenstedtia pulmonis]|uniref:Uncharacterized protein n=1 Tax=Kroppenstedtia pulmonis TaxID=1380685 RepID=A0A7D4CL11_9BACL|nr:hypothetical protein [Kroppenstedtia pulmonis]QKG83738.1 hypothetical protein GXN76_04110 [Kroppenstedtia pulmonis]
MGLILGLFFVLAIIMGIVAFMWRPTRKAIGLVNIIIGTILSFTVVGAIVGIPMIIFGAVVFFIGK